MLDLQLDKITEGVLICTIKPDGSTGSLFKVGAFSELHGKYRLVSVSTGKHIGLIPTDGVGYYAMHSRDTPHFFYSANPEHIEKARQAIKVADKKAQDKVQADKAKLQELQKKINALLDEYGASLDVSLEGDTHGVEAELYLSIGQQGIRVCT